MIDPHYPWIKASHCTIVAKTGDGQLCKVRCPGILCATITKLVDLVDGRIGPHVNPLDGQQCSWAGIGIHDDSVEATSSN